MKAKLKLSVGLFKQLLALDDDVQVVGARMDPDEYWKPESSRTIDVLVEGPTIKSAEVLGTTYLYTDEAGTRWIRTELDANQ